MVYSSLKEEDRQDVDEGNTTEQETEQPLPPHQQNILNGVLLIASFHHHLGAYQDPHEFISRMYDGGSLTATLDGREFAPEDSFFLFDCILSVLEQMLGVSEEEGRSLMHVVFSPEDEPTGSSPAVE